MSGLVAPAGAVVQAAAAARTPPLVAAIVPVGQMGLRTVEQSTLPEPPGAATPPQMAELNVELEPVVMSVTEAVTS